MTSILITFIKYVHSETFIQNYTRMVKKTRKVGMHAVSYNVIRTHQPYEK